MANEPCRFQSLREAWNERVGATPHSVFLWTEEGCWTFGEADRKVRDCAINVRALGVRRGDIVALVFENRAELVFVHLGLQMLGAVTMPIMTSATADEISFQLRHSGTGLVITTDAVRGTVEAALATAGSRSPVSLAGVIEAAAVGTPDSSFELPGYDDLAPSALLYTSGSSGRPKGVLLPSGAPLSVALGLIDRIGVDEHDRLFLPTPLAHAVGLVTVLGTAVRCGCSIAIVDRFSPSRFWDQVARSGGTVTCLFPAHLNFLLGTPSPTVPHKLRAIFTHAFNQAFIDRFDLPLHMCWGMTETGALMTMSGPMRAPREAGYIGEPMPNTSVACFGHDGSQLPAGEEGELRLAHRHVMLEYFDDPEATAATKIGGWINSGDLGCVDEAGSAYFLGRKKNVIKRSGENISAEEVENALLEIDDIMECVVFGIPDATRTEEVVAVLYLHDINRADPSEILNLLSVRISKHKLPRYVRIDVDPLPKLENGKFDRRAIISGFKAHLAWDRELPTRLPLPSSVEK